MANRLLVFPARSTVCAHALIEGNEWAHQGLLSSRRDGGVCLSSASRPQIVYPLQQGEYLRAKTVHSAHVTELLKQPGILGVGITSSVDAPGEAALLIYVIAEPRKQISRRRSTACAPVFAKRALSPPDAAAMNLLGVARCPLPEPACKSQTLTPAKRSHKCLPVQSDAAVSFHPGPFFVQGAVVESA